MTMYLSGTYAVPGGVARAGLYGFSGTPSVAFDGVLTQVGGQPSGSMFASYQPSVVTRLAQSSPLVVNAAYVALGQEISVSATIQVDEPLSGNNQVHILVCQDGYHGQSNMVVDVLPSEPFTLTTPGEGTVVTRDFTLASQFNLDDLRIVVLVQDMSSREIHQAALASADYAGTVLVDAEPDGVNAPWRLQGPEGLDITGSGDRAVNVFFTGDYTLTFLDVPGWTLPVPAAGTQNLIEDATISFSGTYTDGPFFLVQDGPLADAGPAEGASLVDFDGDGDLDLHVLNNGATDLLLRNDGDLVFSDVATGPIADAGAGRSSAWADFNKDGHPDVYVGRDGEANLILLGDGAGNFLPATTIGTDDAGAATSVSWVDFNLDGQLDLYVVREGATNLLLNSYGDVGGGLFLFTASPDGVASANSSGADWVDLNGDMRPELHVVNRFNANQLLENTTIGFSDITGSSGVGDITDGVGSAWGDYDNDGDLDLYLTNEGMADRLFENAGDLVFNLITGDNLADSGEGRGVVWADFDQDGHLDLYLVRHGQPDLFLIGDGAGGFTRIPVGFDEAEGPGNTLVCGDLDGDGDLDVFITRQGQSNVLLRNDLATGHFLQMDLTGSETQPDAIGAMVRLTAGGVTQMRQVQAGSGYQAMQARRLHFGLGENIVVDSVEITWPDGEVQTLENVAADQTLDVIQGADPLSPVDQPVLPRQTRLGQAHPNPFNPATTISFALAQDGPTLLEVFTVDGRHVRTLVSRSLAAGEHQVIWTGQDEGGRPVASGTYFYRLQAPDGGLHVGRMALVK